jgi:hypothetical protein
MNFNDGTTNNNLNSSKTTVDAAHESADSPDVVNNDQEKLDSIAMQSAKRAQNRIHSDEQANPDDTLFTK